MEKRRAKGKKKGQPPIHVFGYAVQKVRNFNLISILINLFDINQPINC